MLEEDWVRYGSGQCQGSLLIVHGPFEMPELNKNKINLLDPLLHILTGVSPMVPYTVPCSHSGQMTGFRARSES